MARNVSFAPDVFGDGDDNDENGNNHASSSTAIGEPSNGSGPSSSRLFCPNCGGRQIESDPASGASVCTACGVVVEENAIVSAVEFVEGAGGASSMVGQFVSGSSSKAYSTGNRWGFSRDSRETTLANGRRRIQEVASRLRLGTTFVDGAHRLFTIAVEKNFVKGRQTVHVVAACLYMACRQEKSQHMLIDFSDALQINVYVLGSCFLKFRRLLGLPLELMDPALYIYRFAAHLQLETKEDKDSDNEDNDSDNSSKASTENNETAITRNGKSPKSIMLHTISLTALRLIARMKRDWMVTGRRPAGICAAALLLSARVHGHENVNVSRILCVCDVTVQVRVKELEQTLTAKMTIPELLSSTPLEEEQQQTSTTSIEDFYNNDPGDAPVIAAGGANDGADPPKFTQNKILEARAKALRDGKVDLLDSGQLDNPYNIYSDRWRSERRSAKTAQLDRLYNSLARELESTVAGFGDRSDNDTHNETSGSNANVNRRGENHADADKSGSENDDDGSVEGDKTNQESKQTTDIVATGLLPNVDGNIEGNDAYNGTALVPYGPSLPPHLKHAYPKISCGRDLVLPLDATPEELQDPTQPVEGQVSLVSWKESMPTKMKEELDDLFRTEEEELTREAIFYQLHGDYNATPAAPRVPKRQKRDPDKSTEEHLREAVSARKVSRKINYDALSSIFDESGGFDTGEGSTAVEGQEAAFVEDMY